MYISETAVSDTNIAVKQYKKARRPDWKAGFNEINMANCR